MNRAALEHVLRAASALADERDLVAHGVDESTATLPAGWSERLVPLRNDNTGGATGWCLEVHDLAASKLVAGRERDVDYLRVLIHERMVAPAVLRERVAGLPLQPERVEHLLQQLARLER